MAKTETNLDAALNEAAKEVTATNKTVVTTVEAKAARDLSTAELKRKKLVEVYRNEKKVPVTISPFYAPYLGSVVREMVNGIMVEVPADGQAYNINQTHADHIVAKIKRIDAMLARQKRVGEVSNNFEHAPGELHL